MSLVVHRRATADDMGFVDDAWLKSYRRSHFAGPISMGRYFAVYRDVLCDIRARPGVEIWVAAYAEDPAELFGFLAIERNVFFPEGWNRRGYRPRDVQSTQLLYVYTKEGARREGIAKGLLSEVGLDPRRPFVHGFKTGSFTDVCASHWTGAVFDPLLIRFAKGDTP